MPDLTNLEQIIEALRKVPSKKLRIIELVNRITVRGKPDFKAVDPKELELAKLEAQAYVKQTQDARRSLRRLC